MPANFYNWKRFWCPRDGKLNLSDDGFLWNPDSKYGSLYNPDAVPFEDISKFACLILLGEPGMGKSTSVQGQKARIDEEISGKGDISLWVDLRAYQTDVRLIQAIFDAPVFKSWLSGSQNLHLFLDSLDECLLRIDTVAALLVEELPKYPIDRLHLRIACRTADWPTTLEQGLMRLWGDEAFKVYELAPLRRVDIIEAAKTNRVEPGGFLTEIVNREVVPLAIKPVTLQFLLNTYNRHGQFPKTQSELYLEGCRLLCEETSDSRRDARIAGFLDAKQRVSIASRMAALTIFTNRYAIWTAVDRGDVPGEDVTISELCGGKESVDANEFEVSEAAIREALDTGLFSSRGTDRMGWAHQTYAEFLAASYLIQRKMTPTQMMSVFVHAGASDGKLVPQLHETAAWLAGMEPVVFREIMKTDPAVLLSSDVTAADTRDRIALVGTLLELYDKEQLLDRDLSVRTRYDKLTHPELTEQLKPYITDQTKGVVVRRVAVDIAAACNVRQLQDVLADVALDLTDSINARVNAAYAVGRIGDDQTKTKLKPLAFGEIGDDPDDELKGCGLQAVWPSHVSSRDLFSLLTVPKRSNLIGAYRKFLETDLPQTLQASDLPDALSWTTTRGPRHKLCHSFKELLDAILMMGWQHLDFPGVLEAFAKATFSRLKHYDNLLDDRRKKSIHQQLRQDHSRRQQLLAMIIHNECGSEQDATTIVDSVSLIAFREDVMWMLDQLATSGIGIEKSIWCQLISRSFDRTDGRQVDAVLTACDREKCLSEELDWLINPVELGSQRGNDEGRLSKMAEMEQRGS